jgi:hypothetical protein
VPGVCGLSAEPEWYTVKPDCEFYGTLRSLIRHVTPKDL